MNDLACAILPDDHKHQKVTCLAITCSYPNVKQLRTNCSADKGFLLKFSNVLLRTASAPDYKNQKLVLP
eukprot:6210970-Pleurochrysis_carterae.AAC.2